MSQQLLSLYERMVMRRPMMVLIFLAILTLVMSAGLHRFSLDASSDSLTLESDTDVDFYREVASRYGNSEIMVVTYRPNDELYSEASLARLAAMRDELAQLEPVKNVLSILDVPLLYSPKLSITALGAELPTLLDERADRELAKQEFHQSPIYRDTLVSEDNRTTAILMNLYLDETQIALVRERDALRIKRRNQQASSDELLRLAVVEEEYKRYSKASSADDRQLVADVRAIAEKYKGDAQIFVGGALMINADILDFIRSDLAVFGSGILLFIVLTLIIIFRRPRLIVLPLATCLCTALITVGALSWCNWNLTVISSNFVSLLLIVTLALAVHLVVRYVEEEQNSIDEYQRVKRVVTSMVRPCVYTVLTTVVAFASLVVSDIRPVIDFGWMMTIGILVALAVAFLLVPAGLLITAKTAKAASNYSDEVAFTQVFARVVDRFPVGIFIWNIALAAMAIYGLTQLKVENRFIDYFKSNTEIHQGMLVIDNNLGGTISMDIIIDRPAELDVAEVEAEDVEYSSDDFADFDDEFSDDFGDDFGESDDSNKFSYWWNSVAIKQVEQLHRYLEDQPEIGKVNSIATLYWVGSDLAGGPLNDIEMNFMRNGLGDELEKTLMSPYLNDEIDQIRISTRVKETGENLQRAELLKRVEGYIINELGVAAGDVRLSGLLVLYNNMLQSLFGSQIQTLAAVFIGIMLMFLVLFRSIVLSVIAMTPNLLAAAVVLGVMGLAGIPLDIMTITIAAITVGMGVDHSIHYIHRFKTEFAKDSDYKASLYRSHKTIGRALFYTAITIIAGFSILTLSNFIPSIYFGVLTSIAMLMALLGSLTLLPAMMLLLKPLKKTS